MVTSEKVKRIVTISDDSVKYPAIVLSIQYAIANILIICYDYKRRIISIDSLESLF